MCVLKGLLNGICLASSSQKQGLLDLGPDPGRLIVSKNPMSISDQLCKSIIINDYLPYRKRSYFDLVLTRLTRRLEKCENEVTEDEVSRFYRLKNHVKRVQVVLCRKQNALFDSRIVTTRYWNLTGWCHQLFY